MIPIYRPKKIAVFYKTKDSLDEWLEDFIERYGICIQKTVISANGNPTVHLTNGDIYYFYDIRGGGFLGQRMDEVYADKDIYEEDIYNLCNPLLCKPRLHYEY